ncbi:SRPBCC family protein [Peteryoungia ipomoeae]|uniref:SRPBCC domain-containing protein n=1 Tax=Peteryoungia ipomoeae TaxID=1210932 RepID=A0A4V4HM94_9HYPH|nr:SRPBCC domain-containing protein [Peteryoungia ipomoeae]THV21326.1 SRPBCC domain-containing protein [Peteryoungia ipomoeae]
MTDRSHDVLTVTVERHFRHAPEKLWRALTQPELIADWLMQNAFSPEPGHAFTLVADWGTVDCEVQVVEPNTRLAYSWNSGALRSLVTWTLTPSGSGTLLRMEQTGFRRDQPQFYGGAKLGWPRYFDGLEALLDRIV